MNKVLFTLKKKKVTATSVSDWKDVKMSGMCFCYGNSEFLILEGLIVRVVDALVSV
jgi:hypothetical protein